MAGTIIKAIKSNKETEKAVFMTFAHYFDSKTTVHFHSKKSMWVPKSVFTYVEDNFAAVINVQEWFYKKNMQNLTDGWGFLND